MPLPTESMDKTDLEVNEALLREASAQLRRLRQRNEVLEARCQTFDSMMTLLWQSPPRADRGKAQDIVWAIERHLAEASDKRAKQEKGEPHETKQTDSPS